MGKLQLKLVERLLKKHNIPYEISEHEPVYTSEQAAKVRGVELRTGVKALVLKDKEGNFIMGLVAANKRIHIGKLAEIVGTKSLRLAAPQEVLEKTGCKIGSVHPFGCLYGFPTYLDISVLENDRVNFNAGMHTVSIQMRTIDLVNIIDPIIERFSEA